MVFARHSGKGEIVRSCVSRKRKTFMDIWNKSVMASAIVMSFALAGCDVGREGEDKARTSGADKPATTAESTSKPSPPGSPPGTTSSPSSTAGGPADTGAAGKPGPAAKPGDTASPGTTAGQKVDDVAITSKVKTALLADPGIKGTSINVTTVKGEVQLSGNVKSEEQAQKAMEIARSVEGVTGVQNNLQVKPG
jgi:hyperosmotically inducible protein